MTKITFDTDILQAIRLLELKQEEDRVLLKNEFQAAYEYLKPINLIKSTFKEVIQSNEIKNELLNAAIGLAAGIFTKSIFKSESNSAIKKLLRIGLLFGISKIATRNAESIKTISNGIIGFVKSTFSREKTEVVET